MNSPLTGCTLSGSLSHPAHDFSAVSSSLLYQAKALGIAQENDSELLGSENLAFDFITPKTSAVRCQISRWQDVANTTAVTENTMQAACGLMSVHGRASGKVQALGVDYISTLSAVLALQGGIAGSIAQLRGLGVSNSHVSMSAAGLLAMGQYIAGATAEEMPERLLPDDIKHPRCPPFVSKDGVIFELETLSPEPWQKFWAEIGVTSLLAGK
ncbi:MAG: carnitine dehydratase, partial [Methylococcaceae bacterium]|nr:carnitine dehydratase [Methylococcaceae bacterium]